VPFSRVLYIEQDDFREDPPKKFFRLGPGREPSIHQTGGAGVDYNLVITRDAVFETEPNDTSAAAQDMNGVLAHHADDIVDHPGQGLPATAFDVGAPRLTARAWRRIRIPLGRRVGGGVVAGGAVLDRAEREALDRGGDENWNIYCADISAEKPQDARNLTPNPEVQAQISKVMSATPMTSMAVPFSL